MKVDKFNHVKDAMKILIKFAANKEIRVLEPESSYTVHHVKMMIESELGLKIILSGQTVLYNRIVLETEKTLAECNVKNWSLIHAIVRPVCCHPNKKDDVRMTIKMSIKVAGWCKCNSKMADVKPCYTARDIKALMESYSTGCPLDQFVVSHNGRIFEDSMTLADCSLDEGSLIHMWLPESLLDDFAELLLTRCHNSAIDYFFLAPKQFFILVRGCGWEESVLACTDDTIRDIKKKFEKVVKGNPNQQVLTNGKDMARFEEEKTLGHYGINEGFTFWVLGSSMKFSIKMPQVGDQIVLNGYGVNFISDIKRIIYEKMGIPCNSQNLLHAGKLLDDDKSLKSYNIGRNSVVHAVFGLDDRTEDLESKYLTIIMPDNNLRAIKVKNSYTISDVKTIIESTSGIPICVQELFWHHRKLKDWKTVSDYNMENLSTTIVMEISGSPVSLFVNTPSGEENKTSTIVLKVKISYRVDAVMDMIPQKVVKNINGKPCLFLDDIVLEGNKMLAHYGIQPGCRLCLDRLIQINVTGADGGITKVNLKPCCKISAVKEKIEEACKIPYGLQKLTYLGDELDDDMTLKEQEDVLGSLWVLRWNFNDILQSFFWPSYCLSDTNN